MQVFVRHQFETDDDALRISLDTMDDLLALMEMERCAAHRQADGSESHGQTLAPA